jgi:ribosome biogenesis GTPase
LPRTDLSGLGWTPHFARQLAEGETLTPARVAEIHRDRLVVLPGPLDLLAPGGTGAFAVGDWLLHDGARARRRLTPATEIARKAAGERTLRQRVAANVDALAIVTSANAEFSLPRLERTLALALEAGCLPLVVVTKADLADPAPFVAQARRLSPLVTALALNALDALDARRLDPWAGPGRTLALVGSSGTGKTTLTNALTGAAAATAAIREDDAKGRHTTTARALRPALAGGWVLDTPGMRELGLVEAASGVAQVFADIADLAALCRFRDCAHEGEPGCAVAQAMADGRLDEARLRRWRKLAREERHATGTLHERHARARAFSRLARDGQARARHKRRGPDAG